MAAVVPIAFVTNQARPQIEETMRDGPLQQRVQLMGHYLRNALPPNAVVLTYLQSGAASLYTGHPLVRLDLLEPHQLDTVIRDLWRRGYEPVLLVDLGMEGDGIRKQFAGQEFGALDWAVVGLVAIGSLAGGWIGAHLGRRLSPVVFRTLVVLFGYVVAIRLLIG